MREKILNLMKNEGLKSSQLAEMLEINPAGVSHILAGRNKPGFDLLQKILRRFPQISPDWLLLDQGPMYRADKNLGAGPEAAGFSDGNTESKIRSALSAPNGGNDLFQTNAFSTPPISGVRTASPASGNSEHSANFGTTETGGLGSAAGMTARQTSAGVSRIVIFYDDQTCETYSPTKR